MNRHWWVLVSKSCVDLRAYPLLGCPILYPSVQDAMSALERMEARYRDDTTVIEVTLDGIDCDL